MKTDKKRAARNNYVKSTIRTLSKKIRSDSTEEEKEKILFQLYAHLDKADKKGVIHHRTASRYYYGKSCSNLTRTQTMKLISILTNPVRYTPQTYNKSPSARQRYNLLQRYF